MQKLVKGANVSLPTLSEHTSSVVLSLAWSSATGEGDADVSVLLLDENGKVRSDADFYFYNHPVAENGSVQLLGKTPTVDGNEDRITFDLEAIPPDVERAVVAASRYGGARFGDLDDLGLTLADASGESLLRFSAEDAGEVSAFIFGELYRRSGAWKFRAVGQGYASGLAGLAADFGVNIEDDAADESAAGELESEQEQEPEQETAGPRTPSATAQPHPVPAPRLPDSTSPESASPETASEASSAGRKLAARPRTARKKVTLPRTAKQSLAENDSWRAARLFPVSALKNDRDREMRATSVLLSVMAQVPEFGRRLMAAFGAPAGRMETFTEVSLPHGDSPVARTVWCGWSEPASCGPP